MGHFAGSFVFNGLTSFSFRSNRERRPPAPTERRKPSLPLLSEKQ
jgi:hypothetical protein